MRKNGKILDGKKENNWIRRKGNFSNDTYVVFKTDKNRKIKSIALSLKKVGMKILFG